MAAVGITSTFRTSEPVERIPAVRAASRRSPEIRVSLPTTNFPFPPGARKRDPTLPKLNASSGERSSLAIPLIPSVPKSFGNFPPRFPPQKEFSISAPEMRDNATSEFRYHVSDRQNVTFRSKRFVKSYLYS